MATYVNDLRLKEIATGDEAGTWGTSTNTNLELIGEALGYGTQDCFSSDADATTTVADGATDPARSMYFKVTSSATLTATRTLTIAPNTISRVMFIENATTGSQSINISQGSGANVTIATGKTAVVYLDGAGSGAAVVDAMALVDPGVTDTLAEVLVAGNTSGGTGLTMSSGDDLTLTGASYNVVWDSSDSALEFADNAKAVFGAGSDLQIYHDGSHSYVKDNGTGNLRLQGATTIQITDPGFTSYSAQFDPTGAATLYHNNSAKLATTSTGIDVTGTVTADGLTVDGSATIQATSSPAISVIDTTNNAEARLQAFNSTATVGTQSNHSFSIETNDTTRALFSTGGDISFYEDTGTTPKLTWDASAESLGIGTDSPSKKLSIKADGGGSQLGIDIHNEGTATGDDAVISFETQGSREFTMGLDRSATSFVIAESSTLGSNQRLVIDDSGNVGIGTASPNVHGWTTALSIDGGTSNSSAVELNQNGTKVGAFSLQGDQRVQVVNHTANPITFHTNGIANERMRIDSSGDVGIGTSSPDTLLHISAPSTSTAIITLETTDTSLLTDQTVGEIRFEQNDLAAAGIPAKMGAYAEGVLGEVGLRFYTGTGATANERMRIDSSGQVGIGTASPGRLLELYGTSNPALRLNNGTDTTDIGIATSAGAIATSSLDGALVIARNGANAINLATNGNVRATVDSSGNVGIGTSSPSGLAHLSQAGGADTMLVFENTSGTNPFQVGQGNDDSLRFYYNASEKMRITSGGNVGIGTTTPSAKLDIFDSGAGNANSAAIELTNYDYGIGETGQSVSIESLVRNDGGGTSTTGKIVFGKDSDYSSAANRDGNIQFYTNQSNSVTEAMRIDSAGNLLVGTTNSLPADNSVEGIALSPQYDGGIIQVSRTGQAGLTVNRRTSDGDIQLFKKDGTTVGSIGTANSGDLYIGNDDTTLLFAGGSDAILPRGTAGATRDAAIDLGLSAHRFKDLYLSGGISTNTTTGLSITANATNRGQLNLSTSQSYQLLGGAYYGYTGYKTGGYHRWFGSDGAEDMRLDSSGNLAVGCTSQPDASNFGGFINPVGQFRSSRNNTGASTQFSFNNPNGEVGTIVTNGSATAYNTSSDQRLKSNIVDAPSASDDIDAIQVRSFDWKVDGSHQRYGMVAQELVTVAPEAVSQPEDPEEMMGVDYSKLVPMMLKEIQQLRARVAQLEGAN